MQEISNEAKLALFTARWVVHNNGVEMIEDLLTREKIKWERFKEIITYHELFSFAYIGLKKYSHALPNEGMELLRKSYYYCLAHQNYLWLEFLRMVDAFRDKGIDFIPLKGAAFLVDNIYGEKAYLRPMVDIDILIKKEALPLVEKIMQELRYGKPSKEEEENYWKAHNYHLPFTKERQKDLSYIAEVHWALDYKRDKPLLPCLWDRIKKFRVEDRDIYLLSPEDTLFSLALHQRRFGKMLCLKNICDTAVLLNRYKNEIDWDYVLTESKTSKIRTTLYFILAQIDTLLNVKAPSFVLRKLGIPRYKKRMIERFILRNTFTSEPGLNSNKSLYLRSHFLLYDNIWEPIKYVLEVPLEQFAKFYRLQPYEIKTTFLYKIRYLCFIVNILFFVIREATKRVERVIDRMSKK
ncbi:MAG: nucleotidyltransferase family protein [Candidatus Omnitrophota bacterium]